MIHNPNPVLRWSTQNHASRTKKPEKNPQLFMARGLSLNRIYPNRIRARGSFALGHRRKDPAWPSHPRVEARPQDLEVVSLAARGKAEKRNGYFVSQLFVQGSIFWGGVPSFKTQQTNHMMCAIGPYGGCPKYCAALFLQQDPGLEFHMQPLQPYKVYCSHGKKYIRSWLWTRKPPVLFYSVFREFVFLDETPF